MNLYSSSLGDVYVHALPQNPDGAYETTNASINVTHGIGGMNSLTVGGIGVNGDLARANLDISFGYPSTFAFDALTYTLPQSTLNVNGSTYPSGQTSTAINSGEFVDWGGTVSVHGNIDGDGGTFLLGPYLSTPQDTSGAVANFYGGVTGQSMLATPGTQINILDHEDWINNSIYEEAGSSVVLRNTEATSFTYQNNFLEGVMHL